MGTTLTTERMDEIAKLAIRLQQISGCAAVTSSGETIMHHTFVGTILSALHDVTAELLASREAQPVGYTSAAALELLSLGQSALIHAEAEITTFLEEEYRDIVPIYTTSSVPVAVQRHECASRKTFPWVEGRIIPAWVRDIASGPQGCENTYIIAELDAGKQSQGWPQFIAAYIDIRLNRYICGNTAENVSDHVLRYLPFDHSEVEPQHAE